MVAIYTDLPMVLFIERTTDAGEYGAARCPHCGAEGRYVYYFRCVDGTSRGAMKGCFAKFPQHPFAKLHAGILDKEREGIQRFGASFKLASWHQAIKNAIEDYADGEISESDASQQIARAKGQQATWLQRRRNRR